VRSGALHEMNDTISAFAELGVEAQQIKQESSAPRKPLASLTAANPASVCLNSRVQG